MSYNGQKWTKERVEKLIELREQGKTLREIGDYWGISRQAVSSAIVNYDLSERVFVKKNRSVFIGINDWMNEHKICTAAFARLLGYSPNNANYVKVSKMLMDRRKITKGFIDGVLCLTGLTYEEAFRTK